MCTLHIHRIQRNRANKPEGQIWTCDNHHFGKAYRTGNLSAHLHMQSQNRFRTCNLRHAFFNLSEGLEKSVRQRPKRKEINFAWAAPAAPGVPDHARQHPRQRRLVAPAPRLQSAQASQPWQLLQCTRADSAQQHSSRTGWHQHPGSRAQSKARTGTYNLK